MPRKGSKRGLGGFPHFVQRFPETRFWLSAGVRPASARALTQAGFHSLADLEGATIERLLSIPKVGPGTLVVLEELLGRSLPGKRPHKAQRAGELPEATWHKRGLPWAAAITFAQMKMTLPRLDAMSREELLALPFVGRKALAACELILGRRLRSGKAHPVEDFWGSQGFSRVAARSLRKAGFETVADLVQAKWREDLPFGEVILRRIEQLLGREIPSRLSYWLGLGLGASMAGRLCRAGLFHLDEVAALSQDQFLARTGLGTYTLVRCERLLGRRLPAVSKYWLHRGFSAHLAWKLAQAGINNPEALEAAEDSTLRAAGLDDSEIETCRRAGRNDHGA